MNTNNNNYAKDFESSSNSNLESGSVSVGMPGSLQIGGVHGVTGSEADSSTGQRFQGTELVMLYDYKAQAPDDLTVRRGDWVFADLSNQTVEGWLWVLSPKQKKYGFIPKAYARPPAMTSL